MAYYVDTNNKRLKVISMSRPEAVLVIQRLVGLLAKTEWSAPELNITEHGALKYNLLFQIEE